MLLIVFLLLGTVNAFNKIQAKSSVNIVHLKSNLEYWNGAPISDVYINTEIDSTTIPEISLSKPDNITMKVGEDKMITWEIRNFSTYDLYKDNELVKHGDVDGYLIFNLTLDALQQGVYEYKMEAHLYYYGTLEDVELFNSYYYYEYSIVRVTVENNRFRLPVQRSTFFFTSLLTIIIAYKIKSKYTNM